MDLAMMVMLHFHLYSINAFEGMRMFLTITLGNCCTTNIHNIAIIQFILHPTSILSSNCRVSFSHKQHPSINLLDALLLPSIPVELYFHSMPPGLGRPSSWIAQFVYRFSTVSRNFIWFILIYRYILIHTNYPSQPCIPCLPRFLSYLTYIYFDSQY